MPLSELQTKVLRLLASRRSPESYVAGASILSRDGPRRSKDIDVFHDRSDAVLAAAHADASVLTEAGLQVTRVREFPTICTVEIGDGTDTTRLEWVVDSDFRFFPTVKDELFGYALHLADIATNKALAAAGRREPRDVLDLLLIHERYLPLGAVVWAASGKDLGFTPEGIIAEIRRIARYQQEDFDLHVKSDAPVDAVAVAQELRRILGEADAFVRAMPAGKEGLLFLKDGRPVQPDPERLGDTIEHAGRRRGHWPGSSEIESAMLRAGLP